RRFYIFCLHFNYAFLVAHTLSVFPVLPPPWGHCTQRLLLPLRLLLPQRLASPLFLAALLLLPGPRCPGTGRRIRGRFPAVCRLSHRHISRTGGGCRRFL